MRIGSLNRQLRIEQRSSTRDPDDGSPVDTWTTVCTIWANVQDVLPSRGERQGQGFDIATRPARVRCRYRSDITSAMRAVDLSRGNRFLKIVSQPAEIGRREGLEFMVSDFTTSGNAE